VKKAMLVKMMVVLVAVALVAGCAGTGKGPTDQELVNLKVKAFTDAVAGKNIDALAACLSENFSHPEARDKAGAKNFFKQAFESGYVEHAKFDFSNAKTKIEKDTANVYPLPVTSDAGSATLGLTLKKEKLTDAQMKEMKVKGQKPLKMDWFITAVDIEGV
jgi:hypothetical protein